MSTRKNTGGGGGGRAASPSSTTSGHAPPPPPQTGGQRFGPRRSLNANNNNRNRQRRRWPADEKDQRRPDSSGGELTLVLCQYDGSGNGWRTRPITFRPSRTTDQHLWTTIRDEHQNYLEGWWRRLLLFTHTKGVVPIEFSRNDVPLRKDLSNEMSAHQFLHAYKRPQHLRTQHDWVDWFVAYKRRVGPDGTIGLEFIEGLWAGKLALVAILFIIGMIIGSVVWVLKGESLQNVFTVMGFILSGVAGLLAVIGLYYQVSLPG